MDQPKGFLAPGQESKVWRLRKALYGLKQAGRQWHTHLHATMAELGFSKNISSDVSIFIKLHEGETQLIVLVYVDDIAIFGTLQHIKDFKAEIATHYTVTDLGEVKQFLGLHIVRDRLKKTISITQSHYIERMLMRFDMAKCKPVYTPLAAGTTLIANDNPDANSMLTSHYQQIVGSLMYAMLGSRPDICFVVNRLLQFGSKPTEAHLHATQHVLQYLSATCDYQLTYGCNDATELVGYCHSDWAADPDTWCSTTGYTFILSGGSIAWATQKQCTVALSSTEAEYMALTECVKHAEWNISLLEQLNFDIDLPLEIYSDSLGARAIAKTNVYHKSTKHIDIRHHYVREVIERNIVNIEEVGTKNNVADLLTKSMPRDRHHLLTMKLGLIDASTVGEC